MKLRFLPGLLLLSLSSLAQAEDKIFDVHVHLWNGEKSVKEYLAQLESAGQHVTGFGGIHMARRSELAHTRAKNDELISLAKRYPKLMPIVSRICGRAAMTIWKGICESLPRSQTPGGLDVMKPGRVRT